MHRVMKKSRKIMNLLLAPNHKVKVRAMKQVKILCLLCFAPLLAFIFSGCQYQFGYGDIPSKYSTISIPFVEGDGDGVLTAELVRQFSTSGALRYVPNGGALTLKVKWV